MCSVDRCIKVGIREFDLNKGCLYDIMCVFLSFCEYDFSEDFLMNGI